jgi:hypothetical protein
MSRKPDLLCPSAPADVPNGLLFGIVSRSDDGNSVGYLRRSAPMSADLKAMCLSCRPEEVFRVAGRCAENGCRHFAQNQCRLIKRITDLVAPVVDTLPRCAIRSSCRWWAEHGGSACIRCPSIVTSDGAPSVEISAAASPEE